MRPQGHQNWLGHEDTKAFWQIKTDQKQMLLLNDCSMIGAGICMFIFHKPESQTVIFNWSKSWFVQKLWYKIQIFPFPFFLQFRKKKLNWVFWVLLSFCFLYHHISPNYDFNRVSTSNRPSEPQFCERWTYSLWRNGQKLLQNGHLSVAIFCELAKVCMWPQATF